MPRDFFSHRVRIYAETSYCLVIRLRDYCRAASLLWRSYRGPFPSGNVITTWGSFQGSQWSNFRTASWCSSFASEGTCSCINSFVWVEHWGRRWIGVRGVGGVPQTQTGFNLLSFQAVPTSFFTASWVSIESHSVNFDTHSRVTCVNSNNKRRLTQSFASRNLGVQKQGNWSLRPEIIFSEIWG